MRILNLRLELEVGAIKEWAPSGNKAFNIDLTYWERAEKLGARINSIAMDGPFATTIKTLHLPMSYAVDQTAEFISLVRSHYPNMLIGDIEPYPAISVAEHAAWLDALQAKLHTLGMRGLDFYRVDPNWVAFTVARRGRWEGVKQIEELCHARHTKFSLIYWASDYPLLKSRGLADADTWIASLLQEKLEYSMIGGRPDQYVIESWIGVPTRGLPDSDKNTFSGSVSAFAQGLPR